MQASPLARILFGVYVALAVYASLYPLADGRGHGLSPFAYLSAPWPRYVTGFDLAVNVLGYVPYGLLCVAALYLNGLTRLASALWAFAALGYLIFLASRRREPVG